jgi:RNA recognition motif-containing protein
MSGEDHEVDLHLPKMTFNEPVASVQVVQAQPGTTFDEDGSNYDRATLYISGIPKGTDEIQLRELFVGYGQIKNFSLFPNTREYSST